MSLNDLHNKLLILLHEQFKPKRKLDSSLRYLLINAKF